MNNSFLIEDTYIEQAQDICKYIDDNDLRRVNKQDVYEELKEKGVISGENDEW